MRISDWSSDVCSSDLYMLFMAERGVGPLYLSAGLVLANVGYSIVILAQMGMGANITPDYREPSRVFAWWQIFNTLGLILVMLMPVLFAEQIVNDRCFTVRTRGWVDLVTGTHTVPLVFLLI